MKTKGRPQKIYTEDEKIEIKKAYKKTHNPKDRSMTPEEEKEFLEPFRQQALAGEILEVSEIINAYANKLNKKVSKSTVYDLLHRHDWRKVMPRSEHPN